MHTKQRYNIGTCLVILGELKSFQNCKGFNVIFPKILETIERFTKVSDFKVKSMAELQERGVLVVES